MRKILVVSLIAVLSISIVLGLFGCEHVHNYVDGVCTDCNEVCAHKYSNGKCTICGINCTHSYSNGKCTICDMDCVHNYEDGECAICGHEDVFYTGPSFDNLDEYLDRYLSNIRADSYVDFASTYDFNFETDPDLYDQGMFWCYYDEALDVIAEVPARDHDKVDELIEKGFIDSNKPTIIFVHGVAVATYEPYYVHGVLSYSGGHYYASPKTLSPTDEDMGLYAMEVEGEQKVNMNLIYLKNGYNVINFVYQRYADEVAITDNYKFLDGTVRQITAANNAVIEAKVYATDGIAGMRYRYPDGTFSDQEPNVKEDVDFSIAEYFVAEYIRTFNYMVERGVFFDGTRTIIKGHSMGGVVDVIGSFLISELIRVNQIPSYYMPSRLILEDSYFGVYSDYGDYVPSYSELGEMGQKALDRYYLLACQGVTCHWTGKPLGNAGTVPLYLCALRTLAEDYNIAIEYYCDGNLSSYASIPAAKLRYIMRKYVATAVYKFSHNGANSHNGIMELSDGYAAIAPIVDLTTSDSDYSFASIGYVISTALTDEQIKQLRGVEFTQTAGGDTDTLRDDTFIISNVYRDGYYPDID